MGLGCQSPHIFSLRKFFRSAIEFPIRVMQPEIVSGGKSRVTQPWRMTLALDDMTLKGLWPEAVARIVGRLPGDLMKAMKNLLAKLVKDEQGGEVLEYALIAGLIVVAAIAIIGAVGGKVLGRWTSLNNSL